MKVHAIEKKTSFIGDASIDIFHYTMFHGELVSCNYERTGDSPVAWLNAFEPSPVIQPGPRLFVTKEVLDELPTESLQTRPVEVEKIFLKEYKLGDFSHFTTEPLARNDREIEELLADLPNEDDLVFVFPKYYEILFPDVCDVAEEFGDKKLVRWNIGPTEFDDPVEEEVSEAMFTKYPILESNALLIRDDVYSRIERLVNWTFFLHSCSEIPAD